MSEESRDEVDDGDHRAAHVYQSANVRRRTGETRSRRRRKDFPHDLELDPTDTIRQPKEEQLAGRYVGTCFRW